MPAVDTRAAGLFLGIGVHPRLSCAAGGYCLQRTWAAQCWPLAIPWLSSFCESLLKVSSRRVLHSLGVLAHRHTGGIGSVGSLRVEEVDGQQEHQDRGSSALHELGGGGGRTCKSRGGEGTTGSQSIFTTSLHLYLVNALQLRMLQSYSSSQRWVIRMWKLGKAAAPENWRLDLFTLKSSWRRGDKLKAHSLMNGLEKLFGSCCFPCLRSARTKVFNEAERWQIKNW